MAPSRPHIAESKPSGWQMTFLGLPRSSTESDTPRPDGRKSGVAEAFMVASPSGAALRALNYTPEVERLRSRRGAGATSLASLISSIGPAYGSVFTRIDCERAEGIELITQGDMFAAEPSGRVIRRD